MSHSIVPATTNTKQTRFIPQTRISQKHDRVYSLIFVRSRNLETPTTDRNDPAHLSPDPIGLGQVLKKLSSSCRCSGVLGPITALPTSIGQMKPAHATNTLQYVLACLTLTKSNHVSQLSRRPADHRRQFIGQRFASTKPMFVPM